MGGSSNTWLLALETSGEHGSVAVLRDGTPVVERLKPLGKRLSEELLSLVDATLMEAGIGFPGVDALGITVGPGSFTGLRVGLASAKGLAAARPELKVAPVGTLDVLAVGAETNGLVAAVMEARAEEVFAAVFEVSETPGIDRMLKARRTQGAVKLPELILFLEALDAPVTLVGSGVQAFEERFRNALGVKARIPENPSAHIPQARWVGELAWRRFRSGKVMTADKLVPLYLKQSYITPAPAGAGAGYHSAQ